MVTLTHTEHTTHRMQMDCSQETLYAMAIARLLRYNPAAGVQLYRRLGSATAIMENRHNIQDAMDDASPRLAKMLGDMDGMSDAMRCAEAEMKFDEAHGIRPLTFGDSEYPQRMRQCDDAPLVLFYRGTADLNQRRIVAMVGTRHCTAYGQDVISHFMDEMHNLCPDTLIMSGLAYGVDINAHRESLRKGLDTVGVLAHGLDYIYPTAHRDTACEMLEHGGLITEFTTNTNADKMNFVRRNRIIAGMADATIVVESAAHGGSLITAGMALDYGRSVFAFPGNVGMPYSVGCNNLIRDNAASLISSADDFVKAMGWEQDKKLEQAKERGIERQLFPELSAEETAIAIALKQENDIQANIIATRCGMAIAAVSTALLGLEMKGLVRRYAGGIYHLMN